jgi:hypothetical protein
MIKLMCKICLERDGTVSDAVVEHCCTNDQTGRQFTAYVCKRCLHLRRETRVTCRSFVSVSANYEGDGREIMNLKQVN